MTHIQNTAKASPAQCYLAGAIFTVAFWGLIGASAILV